MYDFAPIPRASCVWLIAGSLPFGSSGHGVAIFWIAAAALSLTFAALARFLRGVTRSGALAGAVVCFVLYAGAGLGAFIALIAVFSLAWVSTRWGYRQKQKLGTAERKDGRSASQVLANLGVAAICAVLYLATRRGALWMLALAAAMSEAAADTVSSEIGKASATNARLITTMDLVPAGTDGGVSPLGSLAGVVAAALVSAVCALTGLIPIRWAGVSVTAAVGGMIADSYLGATLERRKFLNNDWVNFLSTLVAAAIALLLV